MPIPPFRQALSAPGLLKEVRTCFARVEDGVASRGLTLTECLMSGLAIFAMKYPSLLQFDRDSRGDGTVGANLRSLYGVARAPSDTALRERLDEVDPRALRRAFTRLFHVQQRGGGLEGFTTLDGHYLLSVHGTGYFSSSRVHCASCCEKPLSTVFAYLMMLAFLIDQIQRRCCRVFQHAQAKAGRARYFWEKVRGLFLHYRLPDWETLYRALAFGYRAPEPVPFDTS